MKWLIDYVRLPREVSAFEARYLQRMNRIALLFFWGHLPVLAAVAALTGTGVVAALVLTSLILIGPTFASTALAPRQVSLVAGFTAMCLGALLVHFGQGMVQIEMHFYFFVLIALLAVFANPMVVVVAAVTVALHHALFWLLLPQSVFNYAAPLWVVGVHALFVVVESIAACFVSRSIFDNVIGLDRIVQARTAEVDARNRDMRVILDTVEQGLVTVHRDGTMASERSAALLSWLGEPQSGDSFFRWLGRSAPEFSAWLEVCFVEVFEGALPMEVAVAQLPKRTTIDERVLHFNYRLLGDGKSVLLAISDITAYVDAEASAVARRELVALIERVMHDRQSVVEFVEECGRIVDSIVDPHTMPLVDLKRQLHTLKGNAALFGLERVVGAAHALESEVQAEGSNVVAGRFAPLAALWRETVGRVQPFLDADGRLDVREDDLQLLHRASASGASVRELVTLVESWRWELAERRLQRLAEQATAVARRLGKGVRVAIDAEPGLRLPVELRSVWQAMVHIVRNAIDHGVESEAERREHGKSFPGVLTLRCRSEGEDLILEIEDDGCGIDWPKVAECARQQGLSTEPADLVEALFADGVSTRDGVTEISGRGVGMGAARHAANMHGGSVTVRSALGAGTCVAFRFPQRVAARATELTAAAS